GRLVPVRAELLPAVSPRRPPRPAGRRVDERGRVSLHGAQDMRHSVSEPRVTASSESSRIATELASRQTGMSFQRTQLSADRTLLSAIRTSLSLIGFGFIIAQLLTRLRAPDVAAVGGSGDQAARNFGAALVGLGVAVLVL